MKHLQTPTHLGHDIFDSARVDAIISTFTTKTETRLTSFCYRHDQSLQQIKTVVKKDIRAPYLFDLLFLKPTRLAQDMEKMPHTLSDYMTCEYAFAAPQAVYALKEIVEESPGQNSAGDFYKLINTGTIGKYISKWGLKKFTYLKSKFARPVVRHQSLLNAFGESTLNRLTAPKIVTKGLNLMDACLDLTGEYISTAATLNLRCDDTRLLKIACAILNSKPVFLYLKSRYMSSSWNGALRFNPEMLQNLPVPDLNDKRLDALAGLIDTLLNPCEDPENIEITRDMIEQFILNIYKLDETDLGRDDLECIK